MSNTFSIVLGIASLISLGVSVLVAWMFQKSRADQADLYIRISEKISSAIKEAFDRHEEEHRGANQEIQRLRDFHHSFPNQLQAFLSKIELRFDAMLTNKAFDDFRAVHDREITNLTREIERLREFRHNLDGRLRMFDARIHDLEHDPESEELDKKIPKS